MSDIEIVEDFSSTARCDEGFLRLRRLRVRNRREDGSSSAIYRVDVVDRPRLDAVAVWVHRRGEQGTEVLTRMCLRPAAFFRAGRPQPVPDTRSHLYCEEIVAGLLELNDQGETGLRFRAAAEVREEGGFVVDPSEIVILGPPFLVAPGIVSEKIFVCAVDVTGRRQMEAEGDGTPLEEAPPPRWRALHEIQAAIEMGEIQDAKTEIALHRFLARR